MSDDEVPLDVDPKAATDPLLQEVVRLGEQLHELWFYFALLADPTTFQVDESQLIQISDWKDEKLPPVMQEVQRLQEEFSPDGYTMARCHYPRELPPLLRWLLGEAKSLLERQAEVTGDELQSLAREFLEIEKRFFRNFNG